VQVQSTATLTYEERTCTKDVAMTCFKATSMSGDRCLKLRCCSAPRLSYLVKPAKELDRELGDTCYKLRSCNASRLSDLGKSATELNRALHPWRNSNICNCCSLGRCKDKVATANDGTDRVSLRPQLCLHPLLCASLTFCFKAHK
jgi:hypothetical protein